MIIRLMGMAAAGLVLLSGTAHAYPVKDVPELTHNELYTKGALPKVTCKPAKGTSADSTRTYVEKLVGCLNTGWKSRIKDFQPVKVEFKDVQQSCSTGMDIAGSFAEICDTVIEVRVAADWIRAKDDMKVFAAVTRAWSGVVQGQTGIGEAWWELSEKTYGAEMWEQTHRFYLQKDCLAGVSAKSLGRRVGDFRAFVAGMEPREYSGFKWNGKPANRLHWIKQGYESGNPGTCNTWTASSAKVA
ncbi:hypothetical protein [Nonomuraea indica]|uniref:hypothetical protein n=1 Tax=Nonomuraea indica TaxID=1581193 RepID=UPI001183C1A3|nr:hypothetical protein [Nonomuraea indica]